MLAGVVSEVRPSHSIRRHAGCRPGAGGVMAQNPSPILRRPCAEAPPIAGTQRRIIAVTGGSGGVGKSTTCVNLAMAYAGRGARTLAQGGEVGMTDLKVLLG